MGNTLHVDTGLDGKFLGVRFTAELVRIETLDDADGAVTLHFSNGPMLDIAPGEQQVELIGRSLDFMSGREFVLEIRPD